MTDAESLLPILRAQTSTPENCWFGIWDGYGGFFELDDASRVALPERTYLLFDGRVEAAMSTLELEHFDQLPNLWWPDDHSWCLGSEIDLPWTYLAGSARLIEQVLNDDVIEAQSSAANDPISDVVESWIEDRVQSAVDELLATGSTTVRLVQGEITARSEKRQGRWSNLYTSRMSTDNGARAEGTAFGTWDDEGLRFEADFRLMMEIFQLSD